jgi:hypothetical protein
MIKREKLEIQRMGLRAGVARSPTWQSPFRKGSVSYRYWLESYHYVGELRAGNKSEEFIDNVINELKMKAFK